MSLRSNIARGLLRVMVRNGRSYTLKDFENDFVRFFYGGEKATSGLLINEETAMKFATVYSCIRIISEDIGMLPIEIRKWRDPKNPEKGSDMAYDHPLYDVLFAEPNPEMTSMILEETLQSHVLASGNGYAYKVMNGRGQVTGLKLLNWYSIRAERNESTGAVEYKFDDRGKEITLRFDEVFHIPGLGFDGLSGYSPIRMHMDAIGLGMAAEKFASYFYANGANVGGFIEMPNAVKDKEEMKKEFDAKFTGLGKSHKVIFLENGMKFQKMVMPLQEAQFVETRKYQDQQIAAIYRMPMVMLQNSDKLTYNNAEQQDLAYTKHTLIPWVVRWEQSIQTRLLTKAERLAGYFARFNTDAMLRGDSLTTAQVLQAERQNGIITGNEWRAVKNKNPRPEPEADRLVINGNMRDISVINSVDPVSGQQFKKKEGDEDAE